MADTMKQYRSRNDVQLAAYIITAEEMSVDIKELTGKTHFVNDLLADSLDTVELVMKFEEEFDITIPDEEAEKLTTLDTVVNYAWSILKNRKR